MLTNTGIISFLLYGIFVVITVVAMFVAFYQIKKGNIEIEKLDKMIELFKYAIVSTAIATITLVVADLFKEREQDVKELEYFDKYVEDVKKVDGIQERLQLSKYLSIVAPSGEMKKSWKNYYDTVWIEYQDYMNKKIELLEKDTISNPTEEQLLASEEVKEAIYRYEKPLVSSSIPTSKPTIYIQYCNRENKDLMVEIQKKFGNTLWNAPGIEYKESGCDNSIRYFHEEDRALANEANTLLDNKYIIKKSVLRAPKGQLELWAEN
jgi:DNA-directed RNA polymerase subunit L